MIIGRISSGNEPGQALETIFYHGLDPSRRSSSGCHYLQEFQNHQSKDFRISAMLEITTILMNRSLTSCCLASRAFSYSVLDLSPTMTLSGTTNDLSSLLRFFLVRLPTSGMFSHSSSVTTAKPRFRSANCCWIFGRSARCFASSAFSRASLLVDKDDKKFHCWIGWKLKLTRRDQPACSSSRIHLLVHLLIDSVRFLVVCFVGGTGKQTIFVIRILELVRVYLCVFTTPCLGFPVQIFELAEQTAEDPQHLTLWLLQKGLHERDQYLIEW